MDLAIGQREIEGIRILDLRGKLAIGESEALLRSAIVSLRDDGSVNVILNLENLKKIDDDGADALVYCHSTLRSAGGSLKLLNPLHVHMDLIVLARLEVVLEVFKSEDDAVSSFFPDRTARSYDVLEFVEEQEKSKPPES